MQRGHRNGIAPAIELIGIDKRFGAAHANKDVTLSIAKGSIHGIIGENGARKSTLMSILFGFCQADKCEIRVNGKPARIRSSSDAIALGIGMVHQHFMLVEPFTVLEKVALGAEGGPLIRPALAKARAELTRLARDYELEMDPDAIVGELPVGLQQRVEILKALFRSAQTLILDEPTGVLMPDEADHLFRIVATLPDNPAGCAFAQVISILRCINSLPAPLEAYSFADADLRFPPQYPSGRASQATGWPPAS